MPVMRSTKRIIINPIVEITNSILYLFNFEVSFVFIFVNFKIYKLIFRMVSPWMKFNHPHRIPAFFVKLGNGSIGDYWSYILIDEESATVLSGR